MRKHRDHDPGVVPVAPEDPEIAAARSRHIQFLSEQQKAIAEAARQEAARQQREFGEGNQG